MALNKTRQALAEMFIASLNEGKLPWRACWAQSKPQNAVTGASYRGVNRLMLSMLADERGYSDPRWCTYLQAQKRGWQVRRGEKGTPVEYWALFDPNEKKLLSWSEAAQIRRHDPKRYETLSLRYRISTVFNAAQIDGIPAQKPLPPLVGDHEITSARERLVGNMHLSYREEGDRAYYNPRSDTVTLPPMRSFEDGYAYFSTLLHECGHATGHASRLNRDLAETCTREGYAREELRAEIAATFAAQEIGIPLSTAAQEMHLGLHKAYIQSWLEALRKSPDELFAAIKSADEISDYLMEKGEFHPSEQRQVEATPSERRDEPCRVWDAERDTAQNDMPNGRERESVPGYGEYQQEF